MKRLVLISIGTLLLAIAIAGALWWRHDRQSRSFYTDGSNLQQPVSDAFVREVLWLPATPLGDVLNSIDDESQPHVSPDGATLLFVRGKIGENSDIFISRRQSAGGWSEPEPLRDINTDSDELSPALSPDGHTL